MNEKIKSISSYIVWERERKQQGEIWRQLERGQRRSKHKNIESERWERENDHDRHTM